MSKSKGTLSIWSVGLVVAGLCGSGCASGALSRPVLPSEERALLDLVPDDAYMGVRLDLRAARATPHWGALAALLEAQGSEDLAPHLGDTDRVLVLVGGLIEAPPFEDPELTYDEDLDNAFDEESMYSEEYEDVAVGGDAAQAATPGWAPVARAFGGRLPRAVVVVEGGASALCERALAGQELRQVRGYRLGVVNGIALLVKTRRCVITPEPVLASLLAQPAGPPADVLGMLSAPTMDGRVPIVSYAVDYAAPSFDASLALRLADGRAEVSRERARLDALPAQEVVSAGIFGNPAAVLTARIRRHFALWMNQTAVWMLESAQGATRGLLAVDLRLSHGRDGYDLVGHVAVSDSDRGIMWRELARMVVPWLRSLVTTYDVPEEPQALLRAALDTVRITDEGAGFGLAVHGDDAQVGVALALAARRTDAQSLSPEELDRFNREMARLMEQSRLRRAVESASSVPPTEAITMLEPLVDELIADDEQNEPYGGIDWLAMAYDSVGRHTDAIALLRRGIDHWRARVAASDADPELGAYYACSFASAACEAELAWGFAEEAAQFAATEVGDRGCAVAHPGAYLCQQHARARRGGEEGAREALEELERHPAFEDLPLELFGVARAQLLIAARRYAEAYQALRSSCAGPIEGLHCGWTVHILADIIAQDGSSLAQWDTQMSALRGAHQGAPMVSAYDHRLESALLRSDCARRVRLAPTARETLTVCVEARDVADRHHGQAHPESARARVYLAQAYRAARQPDEAAAIEAELRAMQQLFGPQHLVHAAPTRRPRRPR